MNNDIEHLKLQVRDLEMRISKLENLFENKPQHLEKKVSIKEFLLTMNIVDDIQRTLAISYYLEKYEGLNIVTVKEIEKGYRQAKEPVPSNINYKVFKNIQKGFLMEGEEKKEGLKCFTLTTTGEQFVEKNFS